MLEIRARRFLSTMMLTMPCKRQSGSNQHPTQDKKMFLLLDQNKKKLV
jgi:hypothetical protein